MASTHDSERPNDDNPNEPRLGLQFADVMFAELEIVHQVRRGTPVQRVRGLDVGGSIPLGGEHRMSQCHDLGRQTAQPRRAVH